MNSLKLHKRYKPVPTRMKTEARRILEQVILPHFLQAESCQRILFVGCASYTMWYDKFFEKKEYWTLEPQKERRCYGAKRHIIDSIVNVAQHFKENYLDLVILNGVLGYGLDDLKEIKAAFASLYSVLREGGILLTGWDDHPLYHTIYPYGIKSLAKFEKYHFTPLNGWEYRMDTPFNHVYHFYCKPPKTAHRSRENALKESYNVSDHLAKIKAEIEKLRSDKSTLNELLDELVRKQNRLLEDRETQLMLSDQQIKGLISRWEDKVLLIRQLQSKLDWIDNHWAYRIYYKTISPLKRFGKRRG